MLVVDIETTGTDSEKNAITSIGAIDFDNPQNQFYEECRIFPDADIQQEALILTGLSDKDLNDPKRFSLEEIIKHFLHWVNASNDNILAGHNVAFDRRFLENACKRCNFAWPFGYRVIDLHSIAYGYCLAKGMLTIPTLSLDTILNLVGIPPEPKPHIAIQGAKLEAEAFSRLIFHKNLLLEYKQYPVLSS
jgi:DNA polymerase III epsilon subunit-like protein